MRPFFCQIEAVETAIWLTEVAPKAAKAGRTSGHLANANDDANPELMRLALKLATGAGKTTVMAMLIAWQTINAVRRPTAGSSRVAFWWWRRASRSATGCACCCRMTPTATTEPGTGAGRHAGRHQAAKIVITNYHAFKLRERIEISKGGPGAAPGARRGAQDPGNRRPDAAAGDAGLDGAEEHPGAERRSAPLLPGEAGSRRSRGLNGDDKQEAEKNNEAARMWITGLETVKRKLGHHAGDGPLGDAVLPARVRLCRGNAVSVDDERFFADGRDRVRDCEAAASTGGGQHSGRRHAEVPEPVGAHPAADAEEGAGQGRATLDPLSLPMELQTALEALYGHYEKTFAAVEEAGIRVPPCFIVVCNNTSASKLVYDYISGFQRTNDDGSTTLQNGRLAAVSQLRRARQSAGAASYPADRQRATGVPARRWTIRFPRRWRRTRSSVSGGRSSSARATVSGRENLSDQACCGKS